MKKAMLWVLTIVLSCGLLTACGGEDMPETTAAPETVAATTEMVAVETTESLEEATPENTVSPGPEDSSLPEGEETKKTGPKPSPQFSTEGTMEKDSAAKNEDSFDADDSDLTGIY